MIGISCGLLDGGHDVRVGRAAADIAAHPFADLGIGEFGSRICQIGRHIARHARAALGQHADGRANLARCAVAALKAVMLDEGRLHRMQILAVGEPFDRGDGLAVVHHRERQAGVDAASIDQHRAGAALTVVATFLRAGQREMLTQCIEQRGARVQVERMRVTVDREFDGRRRRRRIGLAQGQQPEPRVAIPPAAARWFRSSTTVRRVTSI